MLWLLENLKIICKNMGKLVPYINTYEQATFSVLTCLSINLKKCIV